MSKTSVKLRRLYIERWNDLSHERQKQIINRNHPVFANFLERHNLAVCDSCFDMFWQEDCPRCNPPEELNRYEFDDEINRQRDREIYVSVR